MWQIGLLALQLVLAALNALQARGAATEAQKAGLSDLLKKALADVTLASEVRADIDAVPDGELRDHPAGNFRD